MPNKRMPWSRTAIFIMLVLLGLILISCSMPIFSYTIDELKQVPMSQTILDQSFIVHQNQDKINQFQLSIGQTLHIRATGNSSFDFLLANFTSTDPSVQPDQPDVTYVLMNNTAEINTDWSPTVRLPEPGGYYLVFLALDVSSDSPVQVLANVTKTWTDLQTVPTLAPDRKPLLDENFRYLGAGITVFGATALSVTLYSWRKPRSRSHQRLSVSR